jgi:hypothetical protein
VGTGRRDRHTNLLSYIRGPEGIIVELAEPIGSF